jgi:hypothetical protein
MLNKIIHEIRRVQDFMIKINNKSKIANAITKKLEDKNPRNDCYEITLQPKTDEDENNEPNNNEIKDI